MTGRGSRPTDAKSAFTIIDMGGNAVTHGDWCDSRDWDNIFHNPPKKNSEDGVGPVKNCPECDAIMSAGTRICKQCGFEFPTKEEAKEVELSDFVIVTKGIDVKSVIEANRHRKEYYPFYHIGENLAKQAKNTIPSMTNENADFILEKYNQLAKEWCHAVGKKFNQWHQERAKEHLFSELSKQFKKWNNPIVSASTVA
jgi:RNA polymerase subunit RPABC4/transcription elongation factor Spt4